MRLIETIFPAQSEDDIRRTLEHADTVHWRIGAADETGSRSARAVVTPEQAQTLMDALQSRLEGVRDWRVVVLPVEATLPKIEQPEPDKAATEKRAVMALREEVYEDVAAGAKLGRDFLALTVLSTIVAAIGLSANNVAVVIGAMVIAPLLGPLLAFSFAGALGDLDLMIKSAKTALAGLAAGVATAFAVSLVAPLNLQSPELLARTDIGLDSIIIALASGAAAALSVSSGLSSSLVGVMLAVALVPPAAAMGLYAGGGEPGFAARAGVLLAANVVCINLSAQAVYLWMGVRPRTWLERLSAKRATRVTTIFWAALLIALVALILYLNARG
ncbi:MAG: TIGR00341 family protein [Maricaulaceae bacterium]|jgi:uncharacterized hydrophobic protein (TIGR00341 family)